MKYAWIACNNNAENYMKRVESGVGSTGEREPTVLIIKRICEGDNQARELLLSRYMPILRRWAHGRLPAFARTMNETDDLVQTTLLKALKNVKQLRLQYAGSFLSYLRQTILNIVRDEIRQHTRRQIIESLDENLAEQQSSTLLDQTVGYDQVQAYERALEKLPRRQQQLIIMRLEFGMSYAEIAEEAGGTSDAARMMISRAMLLLAKTLDSDQRK